VLSWPLVAVTVAVSGWVLYRTLPPEHPGLRVVEENGDPSDPAPDGLPRT